MENTCTSGSDRTTRPIATMNRTDGSITMNFQEIHLTLVEAWRPIFAWWDGGEEPRYSDFEEHFGRFIPDELVDAKKITGVELRVNGNNSRMRCTTRLHTT